MGVELSTLGRQLGRVLAADEEDAVLDALADLARSVTGARGCQLFRRRSGEVTPCPSRGELSSSDEERLDAARRALDPKEGDPPPQLATLVVSVGSDPLAIVLEGGSATEEGLKDLLEAVTARALESLRLKVEREAQKQVRVGLFRYVPPTLAATIIRGDHDKTTAPSLRPVSVLAFTLDGFHAQIDQAGPERFLPVVNQYFGLILDTVYEHEGALVEVGLDRVTVVFGAPISADEPTQADLATGAALTLVERLQTMATDWSAEGFPLHGSPRVGVSTGTALVGSFGPTDRPVFAAFGLRVALAHELAKRGAAGEVVIDGATRTLLAERVATEPVGTAELEGLDYPVFAYRVVRKGQA